MFTFLRKYIGFEFDFSNTIDLTDREIHSGLYRLDPDTP